MDRIEKEDLHAIYFGGKCGRKLVFKLINSERYFELVCPLDDNKKRGMRNGTKLLLSYEIYFVLKIFLVGDQV